MDFKLRPYQSDFANNIALKLKEKRRVIACAATGSGKTKTFVWITHKAVSVNKAVLILTESRSIFDQITSEFNNVIEIKAGVKTAEIKAGVIYIGMVQTLSNRKAMIKQFNELDSNLLIINDEAHIGTSTKLLKQLENAYLIGFTATPNWKEAKHLTDIYNDIVIGKQPAWLVENGYLSPYYHYARVTADLSGLKIKNGEYDKESQSEAFGNARVYNGIFDDLNKFSFYKCMVFCSSIEHADNTAKALTEMGYNSVSIHSQNPESAYQMHQFKTSREINVCVSVGQLTKGFDFPPVDLVILNRATTSLPLYLQMVGRGSRIAKGKDKFTVVDYGDNAKRLGLWITDRDWKKLWCEKKKPREKLEIEDYRACDNCGFLLQKDDEVCPACGVKPIEKPKPKEKEPDTKLAELTASYNGIRGKKLSQLTVKELMIYREFSGKKKFCIRIARSKGRAYFMDFLKLAGYKSAFANRFDFSEKLTFNDFTLK